MGDFLLAKKRLSEAAKKRPRDRTCGGLYSKGLSDTWPVSIRLTKSVIYSTLYVEMYWSGRKAGITFLLWRP